MSTSESVRKRPRRPSGHYRDSPRRPGQPTRGPTWAENVKLFAEDITDEFNTFFHTPMDAPPAEIVNCLNALRSMCLHIVRSLNSISKQCVNDHPQHALASLLATSNCHVQTDDLVTSSVDTGVQSDPLPTALLTNAATSTDDAPPPPPTEPAQPATSQENSWARVTSRHRPRRPRAKPPAAISKPQPTNARPANPTRVIADLQGQPILAIRALAPRELHKQLTEACAAVPKTANLLAAHWTKKGNLVLSFPSSAPHDTVESAFPAIRSAIGSNIGFSIRFDVPWSKIHLAGICARESLEDAIVSEEDLRISLLLNPAIEDLKITLPPSWLKKPEDIVGTHTSAVIAFEDPDGSIERKLLKTTLFAFGEKITVRKWHAKPRIPARDS